MDNENRLIEIQVASEEIFQGKLLHVFRDTVELPDGAHAIREYIRHVGAVCMVAITEDRKIIMERQYRYPHGKVVVEIPAGKLDSFTEDRLEAAKRELKEETGLTADHWQNIGDFIPTPAYTQEVVTMFLATGLHSGETHLDDEEFLEVFEMPLDEVVDEILKGNIVDGKTVAAVLKAYMLLKH